MKKYILSIIIAICMFSCTSLNPCMKQAYYIDFSPFEENGLFVTPSMNAPFSYTTIGKISIELISGYDKKDNFVKYTHEDAIKELSDHLKKIGADGCIGLDYSYIYKKDGDGFFDPIVNGYDVVINGYAIKKK